MIDPKARRNNKLTQELLNHFFVFFLVIFRVNHKQATSFLKGNRTRLFFKHITKVLSINKRTLLEVLMHIIHIQACVPKHQYLRAIPFKTMGSGEGGLGQITFTPSPTEFQFLRLLSPSIKKFYTPSPILIWPVFPQTHFYTEKPQIKGCRQLCPNACMLKTTYVENSGLM